MRGPPAREVFMLAAVTWTAALVIGLSAGAKPLTATAILESPKRHVRATERSMRALLKIGFDQSPTFAALMRRLEMSDLTVYVEEAPRLPGGIDGRLIMLPSAHGFRYVRLQIVRRGTPSDTIAIIGHELRHAVEVADALDVTDERALEAFYRRIGIPQGDHVFDTEDAREAGQKVRKELAT